MVAQGVSSLQTPGKLHVTAEEVNGSFILILIRANVTEKSRWYTSLLALKLKFFII